MKVKNSAKALYRDIVGLGRYNSLVLKKVLMACPVCESVEARVLHYPPFKTPLKRLPAHDKYLCENCGHVYSKIFPEDILQMGKIYTYCYGQNTEATPRKESEKRLQYELIEKLGRGGAYLDFSCGNNFSVAYELRKEGTEAYACEIREGYPYDDKIFFRYNPREPFTEKFDGISSVDAIEHIQGIRQAWQFFNKSLKKNGLMAHSFPTTFKYGHNHHFFRIPFHTCLFSEKSLRLWSKKMGFKYLGEASLKNSDVGVSYWFKKTGGHKGDMPNWRRASGRCFKATGPEKY
ncbi:MAG: methyltransferase domain-containing protein [Candidatus Diapherotrites archaeon]|nr:methyltransferase domain-containing protein [Candidatus Diapherotrites archaeon]